MQKMKSFKCCEDTKSDISVMGDTHDEPDNPPNSYHVTTLNFVQLVFSIIFHCSDVGFDIYVAYSYFIKGRYPYFAWSIALILLPSFIITAVSIRMYTVDNQHKHPVVRVVLWLSGILIQSAPLIRNFYSFYYALRARRAEKLKDEEEQKEYFEKMLEEDSDTAFLKVLEAYLESAPQQILQSILLLIDYSHGYSDDSIRQIISIASGFLSMALSMANYNRTIRFDQHDKGNITLLGLVVQYAWHLNFTVSRILSITAVAALYQLWTCLAIMFHWCAMTSWLAVQLTSKETTFCGKSKILQFLFSCVLGAVYIFNLINVNEGPTQKHYLAFFLLIFVENVTAVTIWAISAPFRNWVYYFFIYSPITCFLLSVVYVVVYYIYLHPNKIKNNNSNNVLLSDAHK